MCDMSVYSTDMFIFIDETGSDNRNALRKYGYSLRGKTPVSHALLVRGERVSAIACMSNSGLLDVQTIIGTSDGDTFYKFVHTHLLPHLMPFNGTNPHSIVILDNCSIHHVPEVAKAVPTLFTLGHVEIQECSLFVLCTLLHTKFHHHIIFVRNATVHSFSS